MFSDSVNIQRCWSVVGLRIVSVFLVRPVFSCDALSTVICPLFRHKWSAYKVHRSTVDDASRAGKSVGECADGEGWRAGVTPWPGNFFQAGSGTMPWTGRDVWATEERKRQMSTTNCTTPVWFRYCVVRIRATLRSKKCRILGVRKS